MAWWEVAGGVLLMAFAAAVVAWMIYDDRMSHRRRCDAWAQTHGVAAEWDQDRYGCYGVDGSGRPFEISVWDGTLRFVQRPETLRVAR